jgi:hypothetical protein
LRVIDISNPAAPAQVWEDFRVFTGGIKAVDDIVYIPYLRGLGVPGLELLDVSNPENPTTLGLAPDDLAEGIAVADGKVYMTTSLGPLDPVTLRTYGFAVIDVTDPSNPSRIGRETALGTSIELAGKLAYVAEPGMTVVDVSDPAAPRRRGSIGSAEVDDLTIYEDRAYLAVGDQGIQIVDLSVLDKPAEVGFAAGSNPPFAFPRPSDVAISNGIAYVTLGFIGRPGSLRTFDVTNPHEPLALGSVDISTPALDVELDAGFAYVAADRGGLQVFDVMTPSAPTAAGNLALPGSTAKVAVVDGIAYAMDRGIRSESGVALRVLDVSEPSAPTKLGAIELSDSRHVCSAAGMAVVGKLVYVTCGNLSVVDVSDPAQPELIYSAPAAGFASSIDVEGDLAYMVRDSDSLEMFDVSDPAQPIYVHSVESTCNAGMLVRDDFAYCGGNLGLVVYDLADPRKPVLLGGFPNDRGNWNGLTIADDLVYGATSSGLQIIELGPEYTHTVPVEIAIRADGTEAPINLAARGLIPVTVFGAADFDVAEIDRSTLRFGPGSATPAHRAGGHLADLNGDGHPDLLSHYWVEASGLSSADQEACVTGQTATGKSFRGCSSVSTKLPPERAAQTSLAN